MRTAGPMGRRGHSKDRLQAEGVGVPGGLGVDNKRNRGGVKDAAEFFYTNALWMVVLYLN